jgi:hypothetical protein
MPAELHGLRRRALPSRQATPPTIVSLDGLKVGVLILRRRLVPGTGGDGQGGRAPNCWSFPTARRSTRPSSRPRRNVVTAQGAGDPGCPSSIATRSAARTSWCSMAHRSSSNGDATITQQLPAFTKRSPSSTSMAAALNPFAAGCRIASRRTSTRRCCTGVRDYIGKNGFPARCSASRAASIRR